MLINPDREIEFDSRRGSAFAPGFVTTMIISTMDRISEWQRKAEVRDREDVLNNIRRERFCLPANLIYLDGNSLGPLTDATAKCLHEAVSTEWGRGLIRSWNAGWFDLPQRLGNRLGPLVGAEQGEVVFTDSVTINLTKLAGGCMEMLPGRTRIVTDDLNFPSDLYALKGLPAVRSGGVKVTVVSSEDGIHLSPEAITRAIDTDTALVTLSHVVFKSGYMHDFAPIVAKAHAVGALVLADLSHSVGSVPVRLGEWGVDLAVGCSYKYLNGGPGAPAFLYVRKGLHDSLPVVLPGWFGCESPFAFASDYTPRAGILRFLTGTPPILSMKAIEAGIDLLREVGLPAIRKKSVDLCGFFEELFDAFLAERGFIFASPRDSQRRGSHIAIKHTEAFRMNRALMEPSKEAPLIIPDFRAPDNLRLGFAPLLVSFSDVLVTVQRLIEIVDTREFTRFDHDRPTVT